MRVVQNAASQYPICTPPEIYICEPIACTYTCVCCVCEFVRECVQYGILTFDHICCQFNKTNKLIEYWIGSSCRHICTNTYARTLIYLHTHPFAHARLIPKHTSRHRMNIAKKSIAPILAYPSLPIFNVKRTGIHLSSCTA